MYSDYEIVDTMNKLMRKFSQAKERNFLNELKENSEAKHYSTYNQTLVEKFNR